MYRRHTPFMGMQLRSGRGQPGTSRKVVVQVYQRVMVSETLIVIVFGIWFVC